MSQSLVLAIAVAYLLMLFAIAWAVERGSKRLGRLSGSSLVYTLSLAVYCSSWTFNGGVGRAALNGFDFLPIYLGPTLASAWARSSSGVSCASARPTRLPRSPT